jgi:putative salt-induced outer membrane protein
MMKWIAVAAAGSWLVSPAFTEAPEWKGEGSLSAGITTGNTDTRDLGIGVKLSRKTELWRHSGELLADYGSRNGSSTKDRIFASGQSDRVISDRLFGFGRLSHEQDTFSGFTSRSFAGAGLGWQALDNPAAKWSLEGGPGVKIDRVKEKTVSAAPGAPVLEPGDTISAFSFIAASRFNFQVNALVRTGNDTSLIYADTSTQVTNKSTLSATLAKGLSARFSFEVRHDTDPQQKFERTDTATRMSVVYAFGS